MINDPSSSCDVAGRGNDGEIPRENIQLTILLVARLTDRGIGGQWLKNARPSKKAAESPSASKSFALKSIVKKPGHQGREAAAPITRVHYSRRNINIVKRMSIDDTEPIRNESERHSSWPSLFYNAWRISKSLKKKTKALMKRRV